MTERATASQVLDLMEGYDQSCQTSESLGGRSLTKTQEERSDSDSKHGMLSNYHLSTSVSSKIARSSSLPSSQSHIIAMHAHEEHPTDKRYEISELHHALKVLQRAARRVQVDQSMTQLSVFRSLAPLAIFLYLLGIGVLIPRFQKPSNSEVVLLFFFGMALVLVFLRGMIWLMSVFGNAFCEVDLKEVFRRGECVDVEGRGMGEAELIVGGLFM